MWVLWVQPCAYIPNIAWIIIPLACRVAQAKELKEKFKMIGWFAFVSKF